MKHAIMILFSSTLITCGQVQYAFTNFAGIPGGPGNVDGTGEGARFAYPYGVAVDRAGNVYVADSYNCTIRKITPAGAVATLAGRAEQCGSADGTGSGARFHGPVGVAVDSAGNVYVADSYNCTIRKITPTREVATLAGSAEGNGVADGTGTTAQFFYPHGVAVDGAGNVYVADSNNHTIRKITPDGAVTTLAGSAGQRGSLDGIGSASRFNGPIGVAVNSAGDIYVADSGNNTIRKISPAGAVTTLAGSTEQYGSTDGTGSAARFHQPMSVAVDSNGNVFVADEVNHTIRKITPTGAVTTLAGSAGQHGSADGTGSAARFLQPRGVAVDNEGMVYVADSENSTIRRITPTGAVTTLAGSAAHCGSNDGTGIAARFCGAGSVAVDSAGNIYVADFNNAIRKITPAGTVRTLAARFWQLLGVAADKSGNLYVPDQNHTIQKIATDGVVTILAGSAGLPGTVDGIGSAARFGSLWAAAVDSAGSVYVADEGRIRKISPAGVVTTLAGSTFERGSKDGIGSEARFTWPTGLAVDDSGNVYVADRGNSTIRKVSPEGLVTTLAGNASITNEWGDTIGGYADGIGSAARFRYPNGVAVDSARNVYVADDGNEAIRKITPAGEVTTLAGTSGQAGNADGIGFGAQFASPLAVAVDSAGNLYVADGNRITKGTPLFRFQSNAGSPAISNSFFQVSLTGPFGSNAVVESSANLQTWMPIQTNTLTPDGLAVSLPLGAIQNQFFRARLAAP